MSYYYHETVTLEQAAERLDLSLNAIKGLIENGELEVIDFYGDERLLKCDLDEFIRGW